MTFDYFMSMIQSTGLTLRILAFAGVFGTVVGLLLGLLHELAPRWLKWPMRIYISVFRGVPILVILLLTYFGLPTLFPQLNLSGFISASIGLTLSISAYIGEITRGGLKAVPVGQYEASAALGFSKLQILRLIILPQGLRLMVAPWAGMMLALAKWTSLVALVGLTDLTRSANIVGQVSGKMLLAIVMAGCIYFVICWPIAQFSRWYERRVSRN